ncbi:DsrE family protein [Desulforhopalus singaporensis]|uniref:Intracellular sulfur oxidation protein, DsrE/DsrF family n=1 Tax=Desulforhopalus singaporensis TaxID=91360 RepID=A0A1H0Q506_9BACT|nr:DsrE family protein [Desulforhopalus singaporensis]SDP12463.1 hypothetical protein SAMN05660330_01853 [Desulforhopalus singaporensis]
MNNSINSLRLAVLLIFCLTGLLSTSASAEQYDSLKGLKSVRTIFDFRDGKPGSALIHLKLVHDTFRDQAIQAVSDKPEMVVVFMDSSVLLLSSDRDKFSEVDRMRLEEFDQTLETMVKDGVRLEVCMFAANLWGVRPESIPVDIDRVANGWIASLGYQQKGFALVPVF